jgi:hypothetical protein
MSKGRLEAFSDGVIAILITIMVLELAVPQGDGLSDLLLLTPILEQPPSFAAGCTPGKWQCLVGESTFAVLAVAGLIRLGLDGPTSRRFLASGSIWDRTILCGSRLLYPGTCLNRATWARFAAGKSNRR